MQIFHLFVSRAWYAFVPFSQRATNFWHWEMLQNRILLHVSTNHTQNHLECLYATSFQQTNLRHSC